MDRKCPFSAEGAAISAGGAAFSAGGAAFSAEGAAFSAGGADLKSLYLAIDASSGANSFESEKLRLSAFQFAIFC